MKKRVVSLWWFPAVVSGLDGAVSARHLQGYPEVEGPPPHLSQPAGQPHPQRCVHLCALSTYAGVLAEHRVAPAGSGEAVSVSGDELVNVH